MSDEQPKVRQCIECCGLGWTEELHVSEEGYEREQCQCPECGGTGDRDAELKDTQAEVFRLRARIAELEAAQQWRPMETAPYGEIKTGEFGEEYRLLDPAACRQMRLIDSKGNEYVATRPDGDCITSDWVIWTGDDEVDLELPEGVTLVSWMPVSESPEVGA